MAGDSKLTINVTIGPYKFTPSVYREEEETYRKATEYINSKINNWRQRMPKGSEAQNLSVVALDLALEIMTMRKDHEELLSEMKKLDDLLTPKE